MGMLESEHWENPEKLRALALASRLALEKLGIKPMEGIFKRNYNPPKWRP